MLKSIRRVLKRIFIFIVIAFIIYLVISNIDLIREMASKEKTSVMIDADPANRSDDLFAIYRLMIEDDIELRGLTSAQWRLVDLGNDSTHTMNQEIHWRFFEEFRKTIIHKGSGADLPLAYTLDKASYPNRAADEIIRVIQELPYQHKLNYISMGSLTNLATALERDPGIADRIICYMVGPIYDAARRTWNKNDPITRLDLDATDRVLNTGNLEIHLMPANFASGMKLTEGFYRDLMVSGDTLQSFLYSKAFSGRDTIDASSLALVEAFLNPDLTTQKQLIRPPENSQVKMYVYTRIDTERMLKDFERKLSDR